MTSTARPRRDDTGRRDELVAATARVVGREGVAGTTTRKIATEAGVPLGTVHYWFASKDELLEALALEHVARIGRAAAEAAADVTDEDPTASASRTLRAALERESDYSTSEQLALYELTTWALRTPGRADLALRLYGAIRDATASACAPWLARHGGALDADDAHVVTLVAAVYDGLALAMLADPEGTDAAGALVLLARLLGGAARPTGRPDLRG